MFIYSFLYPKYFTIINFINLYIFLEVLFKTQLYANIALVFH